MEIKSMEILLHPNPILNTKAEPVVDFNDEIKILSDEMVVLTANPDNGLAGISGNQVGELKRIFTAHFGYTENGEATIVTFINPKITPNKNKGEEYGYEGCASLPMEYNVKRWKEVNITAQNIHGNEFSLTLSGNMARVVQHETDHLNGIMLFNKKSRGMRPKQKAG